MYINKNDIISVKDIMERLHGTLYGNDLNSVSFISSFDDENENSLSFFALNNQSKIIDAIKNQKSKILFTHHLLQPITPKEGFSVITFDNPQKAFLNALTLFYDLVPAVVGISEKADIGENVIFGNDFKLGAFSSIGNNTKIGDNVTIHPNVTIYPNVVIGNNVEIHAGVVVRENCTLADNIVIQNGAIIGADGFGYMPDPEKGLATVPQVGNVKLDSYVDVGANACIDRGAVGSTYIGYSTKIDNLVQIGHNTQVGKFSIFCGLAGIAGSCKIGNGVTLAGGVGVADHVTIADNVRVAARSGVAGNIGKAGDYMGYPAKPVMKERRIWGTLDNLTETIKELKKDIKELKKE